MKILITGGGSALLKSVAIQLHDRGDDVVALQRRHVDFERAITVVSGDIRDNSSVTDAIRGCDAVIHGAARVGVLGSYNDFYSTNVAGTRTVMEAARANGVQKVVHVSTPSVAHTGQPLIAARAEPAHQGRHTSLYAQTKARGESIALGYNSSTCGVVCVRPHLVWGPRDTQLVGRIVERARTRGPQGIILPNRGSALVDTTYIADAADALVHALDAVDPHAACAGKAYVVAGGEPRTVHDLVESICRAAGVDYRPKSVPAGVALRLGKVVESVWPTNARREPPITRFIAEQLSTAHWFDLSTTHRDLQWHPRIGIDAGLGLLAEWFTSHK